MSKNLTELIKTIKNKQSTTSSSSIDKSPANSTFPSDLVLDENSSTAEFRKYLENLKQSYLEKLTFSCPPKMLTNSLNLTSKKSIFPNWNTENTDSIAKMVKNSSQENIKNLLLNNSRPLLSENSNVRRSLLYDYNKNDSLISEESGRNASNKKQSLLSAKSSFNVSNRNDELKENHALSSLDDTSLPLDLTKTQVLSRLVQIREYLKQAYTMLATLQTSNDLSNYSSQMNKLHSLIDHLKDQEKGYMELLDSFLQLNNSQNWVMQYFI